MIKKEHLKVLRKIWAQLEDSGKNWAITGSLGLALQGVETDVHDIDIQTDKQGAYEIERRFRAHVTRKVAFASTAKIQSYFGRLMIDGIEVEIMGDVRKRRVDGSWNQAPNMMSCKHFVDFEGMRIPIMSLEHELAAYLSLGRIEKAEAIRKQLARKTGKTTNGL